MIAKIKNLGDQFSLHILIAAILIGVSLRWFQIGKYSLWYDETFSTLTARLSLSQILSNVALDVHPPAYYLLLSFWMQGGHSEAFIRSLSALFSVGAIFLMYGVAGWLFDRPTATLSALLMAVLPFQVYFGQEARMYSLVICLALGLMWLFLSLVTHKDSRFVWGGYILVAVISLYTHYFSGFLLAALHGWLALNWRQYRSKIRLLLGADSLIIILFLPQVGQAMSRASYYLNIEAWQSDPNILSPLTTIYYLLFAHRTPLWIAPLALFLTVAILTLIAWESRKRPDDDHNFERMLWLSLFLPIITVILISWLSPRSIYVERSFAVVSPALVLLFARGAIAAPRWSPTPYLVALLFLPIIVTLTNHIMTPDPAKPPVREAAQVIEANFAPGDVSLHLQDASAIPALWYTTSRPQYLVDVPGALFIFVSTHHLFGGDVVAWQSALIGSNRLWLTVMPRFVGPQQKTVFEKIERSYPRLNMWDWGTVQLYLYDVRETNSETTNTNQHFDHATE